MELVKEYLSLVDISTASSLAVFSAARFFFKKPLKVREMLSKVYFYEKEADKESRNIKRRLFYELRDLKISQKIHLRYFALHIETIYDIEEDFADMLSISSLKLNV